MRWKKVSVILLCLLTIAGFVFLAQWKDGRLERNNYNEFVGLFDNGGGLATHNEVRFRGIRVGMIKDIQLQPDKLLLVFTVNRRVIVPSNSHLIIGSEGLLGTKYLEIVPPKKILSSVALKPGDSLPGETPINFTDLQIQAMQTLKTAQNLLDTFNFKVQQLDVQSINQAVMEMRSELTALGSQLSVTVNSANQAFVNLNRLGENGQASLNSIDSLVVKFEPKLEQISQSINNLVGDPNMQQDLRLSLRNLRQTLEALRKLCFWSKDE